MKKILSVLFIVASTYVANAQEKILFKLNPELGKTIKYDLKVVSDVEGEANVVMTMGFKMNMKTTDIQDTIISTESKFERITADMDMGLMKMNYDSSKEPENEMQKVLAKELSALLESTLYIKTSTTGKAISIDFPNVPNQMFDKSSFESINTPFPNKAIGIGDSWEINKTAEQLNAKVKGTFTLTSKTADTYTINSVGTIEVEGNVIGTVTGESILDRKTLGLNSTKSVSTIDLQGNKVTSTIEMKKID